MKHLKQAPQGFSRQQWQSFSRDGILVLPKLFSQIELAHLELLTKTLSFNNSQGVRLHNFISLGNDYLKYIDHELYVGFGHSLYGESLRLLSSQLFIRPPMQNCENRNNWHFDGPRVLPFQSFSSNLPLRIKVGVFATDLLEQKMGNLIYIPGSHRQEHIPQYKTHLKHPDEKSLLVPAGSVVIMWEGLWHRVDENTSQQTRSNFYIEYGPSWIQSSEKVSVNEKLQNSLTREQRILLRQYSDPNLFFKPPSDDVPIYLAKEKQLYGESISNDLKSYQRPIERIHL
jgi:hypothetical protein